ncbi:MAG: hypothetical protein M1820_009335 [Bogoriella megaspora]|nr:MAG: hypothetical protein M1820_009335 [Bogoriella megaspora]
MSTKNTPTTSAPPTPHPSTTLPNANNEPTTLAYTSTSHPLPSVPLPSPTLFDIIPSLHELLSRLLPAHTNPTDPTQTAYTEQQSLEIQHLASEASALRIKIQKARGVVAGLVDVERGVQEQEGEMRELEERVRMQRAVLRGLVGR